MTAKEAADRAYKLCWNGEKIDIPFAWSRAAESLEAFGYTEAAKVARIELAKERAKVMSSEYVVKPNGKLVRIITTGV